jgi:Pectic acid lyase
MVDVRHPRGINRNSASSSSSFPFTRCAVRRLSKTKIGLNRCAIAIALLSLNWVTWALAESPLAEQAQASMLKATQFMHQKVAVHGGYVYRVSADLSLREGEGIAAEETVWVQPPGTPAVGMAFIQAYQRTGEETLLNAARDAAHCLVDGQLHSGGWQDHIDFGEQLRARQAYRVDGPPKKKTRNISSFDDDKTQSACRFLATFDAVTKFTDTKVHEATLHALESILKCQFPNGGFGQVFEQPIDASKYSVVSARYPESWPREYPGGDYWWFYTLNDNNISKTIDTLLLASDLYNEPRFRHAALRAADFLLLAQMPEPQPAWAQQYNFDMEPVWARKFEPPAISGSESQDVAQTLMNVFEVSGDHRYLEPIPRTINYLKSSQLANGKLARFYELKSNRPLFMNTRYELTYEPDDLPTHYGFIFENRLDQLQKRYSKLAAIESPRPPTPKSRSYSQPTESKVRAVIAAMDASGAWVDQDKLRYHKRDDVKRVIKSETFISHLEILSLYLAQQSNKPGNAFP